MVCLGVVWWVVFFECYGGFFCLFCLGFGVFLAGLVKVVLVPYVSTLD